MKKLPTLVSLLILLASSGCTQNQQTESPAGYDLANPDVYRMPSALSEISGITFKQGNADTIFAQQDEEGALFYFHLGDIAPGRVKFASRGDYEDIAFYKDHFILLRSDGSLFSFPAAGINTSKEPATEQAGLLPAGEYESLYADETANNIYVLCKNCSADKKAETVTGYTLQMDAEGKPVLVNSFLIDTKLVAALAGEKKINLRPSALAKNPLTGEWYILSSVNKLLVIADAQWDAQQVFRLSPVAFTQPEGMAFDKEGNLFIANEKGGGSNGTILKFAYSKK